MLIQKILVLLILFAVSFALSYEGEKTVNKNTLTAASGSIEDELFITQQIQAKKLDPRAKILADYLAGFNSPLQHHAQDFIDASDQHGVDWKLVPSIAGVESTFGKHIPGGFNAWGWGVYGNQALYFKSWRDGIFTVTEGLKKNYIDDGLTTPYQMNRRYAASKSWGWKVDYFMKDLEGFASGYKITETPPVINPLFKTAGVSAQIALD